MILLPPTVRYALRANDISRRAGAARDLAEPDPVPVLKLFNPLGAATWLATELADDGDVLFGLVDLGFGCPELGYSRCPRSAAFGFLSASPSSATRGSTTSRRCPAGPRLPVRADRLPPPSAS